MKTATKEALLKSIEHWRKNESIEKIEDAKLGPKHCALCRVFLHTGCALREENMLEPCPIYDSTKHKCCNNTPYIEAEGAHGKNDLDAFLKAAKQEREFLESLLPADK